MALGLAKAGYYGGDPAQVLGARVDHVLSCIAFERFRSEYQDVEYELNRDT